MLKTYLASSNYPLEESRAKEDYRFIHPSLCAYHKISNLGRRLTHCYGVESYKCSKFLSYTGVGTKFKR